MSFSNYRKSKIKKKSKKSQRKRKHLNYKGTKVRITSELSSETIQARREQSGIFIVLKEQKKQPRILYPANLSLRNED